jgi:hypothetical protein
MANRALEFLRETIGTVSAGHPQGWSGMYGFGIGAGMPNVPSGPSWPYRTQAAEKVWEEVVKLIPKHPEMNEAQLLQRALANTGVQAIDLSPEDWRLLEMAIEWRKNGIKAIKMPTTGGMPGGPYNQTKDQAYGHELASRGAP